MKKIALFILSINALFNLKTYAQERVLGDINSTLLEKYIQAAKANYLPKKIMDKQAESAKTNIPITALGYLDIFNASYIYRPNANTVIVAPGATANPYLVNGLQFGVNVSLGSFFGRPYQIKKAKLDYEIAKLNADEFNNTLETEVKNRYYNYIQQVAQLKLSVQNLQDITLISEGVKTRFEKTEVSMEVYDQSRINLTAAKASQLAIEINLQKAKDALEDIIGKKLSEIN